MAMCQGKRLEFEPTFREFVCDRTAVTFRKDFRFGDKAKGEPSLVKLEIPLCQDCADKWDDRQAEGAATMFRSSAMPGVP